MKTDSNTIYIYSFTPLRWVVTQCCYYCDHWSKFTQPPQMRAWVRYFSIFSAEDIVPTESTYARKQRSCHLMSEDRGLFCREADSDATGMYSLTPLERIVAQDRDYCWEPKSFQLVPWSKFTQHPRKCRLTPVRLLATACIWTLYNIGQVQKVTDGVFFTPQQRPILKIQIRSVVIN